MSREVNWDSIKIHCSSLGVLFTEPKLKVEKEAGLLSKTAKSHLIRVYIKEYWGRQRKVETKQMKKGTVNEHEGIKMLGRIDGKVYVKNEETKENDWIIGTADIISDDFLADIKLSWDSDTFLGELMEPIDEGYKYQVIGYMWLWRKLKAKVSYCLVDAPEMIILDEKRRLLFKMDVATDENPEYKAAAAELEYQMTYWDIPESERVIDKWVNWNQYIIDQIPSKVQQAREFLKEFHELHTKKQLKTTNK